MLRVPLAGIKQFGVFNRQCRKIREGEREIRFTLRNVRWCSDGTDNEGTQYFGFGYKRKKKQGSQISHFNNDLFFRSKCYFSCISN